jgi:hypothetical protein
MIDKNKNKNKNKRCVCCKEKPPFFLFQNAQWVSQRLIVCDKKTHPKTNSTRSPTPT